MPAGILSEARPEKEQKPSILPENYRFLQQFVYRESGIVLDEDKHYLLETRLQPIAHKERVQSLDDLCTLLRATRGDGLRRAVVEAMTTHETLFFRDLAQYEALQKTVIPRLAEERKDLRKLSFWSAAASSGQEAYSLAMMLLEMGLENWKLNILGTDLSEQILARARQGRYTQTEVNRGLPVKYLLKYFVRADLEWHLKEEVRRMVHWQQADLRHSMRTRGPFDVVLCRNVLIYFDTGTKKTILGEMRGAMYKGGHLLLGSAETTLGLGDHFRRVEIGPASLHEAV